MYFFIFNYPAACFFYHLEHIILITKKSEDSKDLISIESSLYYFVCLVLLLQILQKSIVTLAIIYKFGGYKEKGSRYLKNGTLRIKKYEITTTFDNKCPN